MKKATRIILAAAVFLCLALGVVKCYFPNDAVTESVAEASAVRADATEIMATADTYKDEEESISSDGENESETVDPGENNDETDPNENEGEITNPDENEGEDSSRENGFEQVYDVILMHISEILSLAAFIGSLICAVIYKSGLMPLMENGLKGLKNAAVKIKEATDRAENDNKESINGISDRITQLEETIADMGEAFTSLKEALSGLEDQRAHQMRLDTILGGELDMLYDIFMTSSLPEYEKERVGDRMGKLKEVLNSGEGKK